MPTEQVEDGELREVSNVSTVTTSTTSCTFFADDAVFESPRGPHPWGTRFEGKEAVRKGLAARFEGNLTSTMEKTGTSAATEVRRSGR